MVFYELPQYVSSSSVYIALYLIFLQLLQHQTRSSSHWRLESKLGKVVLVDSEEDGGDSDSSSSSSGESEHEETEEIDQIMEILTTKLIDNEGRWSVNLHTQEIRDMNRKKKQSAWKQVAQTKTTLSLQSFQSSSMTFLRSPLCHSTSRERVD